VLLSRPMQSPVERGVMSQAQNLATAHTASV